MADPTGDLGRLLETMHPMREPPAPESIASILLLLTLGCLAALAFVAVLWALRQRRVALRASAEATLAAARDLAPAERLAVQANLLRRVTRGLAGETAARLQGAAWLDRLDKLFNTQFFTQGAGSVYGEALYRRPASVDLDAMDHTLLDLIGRVRPAAATR